MFDKIIKGLGVIVTLCIGGYYVSGFILNWRQLKQQNQIKKTNNYE